MRKKTRGAGEDHAERLEKYYADAVGLPFDFQAMYDGTMVAVHMLIDNVARRIEWNERENRRRNQAAMAKGEPPSAPPSLAAELERLTRIVSKFNEICFDRFRKEDPDEGARAICRILELARKEYKNDKAETTIKTTGGEEGASGEPDETRPNPTPQGGTDAPARNRNRRFGRGIVKR